uniref:Uncharacterized protein n=1 Tax=Arundo donax TaxID=35708 RepID=A0A0A9AS89_ARUDO
MVGGDAGTAGDGVGDGWWRWRECAGGAGRCGSGAAHGAVVGSGRRWAWAAMCRLGGALMERHWLARIAREQRRDAGARSDRSQAGMGDGEPPRRLGDAVACGCYRRLLLRRFDALFAVLVKGTGPHGLPEQVASVAGGAEVLRDVRCGNVGRSRASVRSPSGQCPASGRCVQYGRAGAGQAVGACGCDGGGLTGGDCRSTLRVGVAAAHIDSRAVGGAPRKKRVTSCCCGGVLAARGLEGRPVLVVR